MKLKYFFKHLKKQAVASLVMFTSLAFAQTYPDLEMGNVTPSVATATNVTVALQKDTSNNGTTTLVNYASPSALTVNFNVNATNFTDAVRFGAGGTASYYPLMNNIGDADNTQYTTNGVPTNGTGLDIASNYAMRIEANFVAAGNQAGNGRVKLGEITINLSRGVNNPHLHFKGLGGNATASLTAEFNVKSVLNSSGTQILGSTVISQLSGTNLNVNNTAKTINNDYTGTASPEATNSGRGTVRFQNNDIRTVVLEVYGNRNGADATVVTWNGLDAFLIGLSAAESDIQVTKTVNNSSAGVGSTANFLITATNNGASNNTNINITDVLPSGYTFVSATPSVGTYATGTGVWNIPTLNDGALATLSINATVNANVAYTNTATVTSASLSDPNAANNTSAVTVNPDTDGDGVPDNIDLDDDNDGILDTVECPPVNLVTNGAFTTNLGGWTAGNGWVYNAAGYAHNVGENLTLSPLSQSISNLNTVVPNGTVSLNLRIGAQDGNNSAGSTASLQVVLNNVVYATLSNSTDRNASNITIAYSNGATGTFTIFGTGAATGYTQSAPFTINIPYTGPNTATLEFRMTSQSDDWSVDDVSINGLVCDLDNDGIPNYLDLDSDGDGCTDAIEGGAAFTTANLVTATGTISTQTPNQNLGNTVGSTPTTIGVPTIAGTGQSVGQSQNSTISECLDSDNDGVPDICDLDDDNDGILDIQENTCALTGQTIRIGYIPNVRDLDADNGYTFDGALMNNSGVLKLLNSANFGPSGIVKANIVLVPMTTNPITKADITSLNLNAIFLGGIDDAVQNSYLSSSEFAAIKDWSDDSPKNFVVSTQGQTVAWDAAISAGNINPDVPTALGNTTSIFNGPFGSVTSFNQGGGYQAYFTPGNQCFTQIFAQDNSGRPVIYLDGIYNDLMIADVDVLTSLGGVTAGNTVTSNNDRLFMNIWAFVAQQSGCTNSDTDGDGIPNHLDLDSDNDGCLDALEGDENVTVNMLVNAASGLSVGTGSTAANQNLCASGTCVNANGVPTQVNSGGAADIGGDVGQGIGDSQNALISSGCYCYKKPVLNAGVTVPTKHGITALNRASSAATDWPIVRQSAWTVLEANTKGFVVNRVAFSDADANPATPTTPVGIPAANYVEGMMVYDTVANCLKVYNGTVWNCYTTQTCPQ